jgi:hypothetical protein
MRRLQDLADTLLNAADALDPAQRPESQGWDAAKQQPCGDGVAPGDDIRQYFGLELTDAGIARRLKKANYGWGGQRLNA